MTSRRTVWALSGLLVALAAASGVGWYREQQSQRLLASKIDGIVPLTAEPRLSCAQVAAARPLVLLALGQSNAANHGPPPAVGHEPIPLIIDGQCVQATDPLPGGSGRGGSIWQRLPAALRQPGGSPAVVVSVLAVDATSIDEWTRANSALRQRLVERIASLRALHLAPDAILWQQGEADVRAGTSASDYGERLDRLAAIVHDAGSRAPIFVARSTLCRSPPDPAIRAAIVTKAAADPRFRLGPDTDTLAGPAFRHDGCHLSDAGLDGAARLWAATLDTLTKGADE